MELEVWKLSNRSLGEFSIAFSYLRISTELLSLLFLFCITLLETVIQVHI